MSAFYKNWVTVFGPPKASILTDNGGEFNSDLLRDFCEKLNLRSITTAAYTPFSNGVCERNNSVLKECLKESGVIDTKLPVLESNSVSEFVVSRIRAIENAESSILKQNTVNVSAKH